MRVAIVHDWLTGTRGGERVLEAMVEVLPQAELFTLVHRPGTVSQRIEARPIHTSFLQRAPAALRLYRAYLPLYPLAVRRLPLDGFDVVISSSHCAAKAANTRGAPHLCYCHTPVRYAWDQFEAYFRPGAAGTLARTAARPAAALLRRWDVATAVGVDRFLANSRYVQQRIMSCYGRTAEVLYPPVECARFHGPRSPGDFYLVLGALVPYKRIDVALHAFAQLGEPLVVAGDGPERARLQAQAGPRVEFLGRVSDTEAVELLARCRALVFPGTDDFGITPVEALAAGAPVVARAAGGALETVRGPVVARDGRVVGSVGASPATGVFCADDSPDTLAAAVRHLQRMEYDEAELRAAARRFDVEQFRTGFRHQVEALAASASARRGRRR